MPRIVIIGCSCSGKTTMARNLSSALGHHHIELDALFWLPDWQQRERDEFRARVAAATLGDAWVVDGNYSKARDILWSRATHLLWLNYRFPQIMQRALRRTLRRGITRQRMWSGNQESLFRAFFTRQSILYWVMTSCPPRVREYRQLFDDPARWPEVDKLELTHPSQAAPLVRHLAMKYRAG